MVTCVNMSVPENCNVTSAKSILKVLALLTSMESRRSRRETKREKKERKKKRRFVLLSFKKCRRQHEI